jgi:hypothetical protein
MRLLALATIAIGIWATTIPALAQTYGNSNYPICLQRFGRFYSIDCSFTSIDQCRFSATGLSAQCISNPYYTPNLAPGQRLRRRQDGY